MSLMKLIEEHEITNCTKQDSIKLITYFKEIYPYFVISITVYKPQLIQKVSTLLMEKQLTTLGDITSLNQPLKQTISNNKNSCMKKMDKQNDMIIRKKSQKKVTHVMIQQENQVQTNEQKKRRQITSGFIQTEKQTIQNKSQNETIVQDKKEQNFKQNNFCEQENETKKMQKNEVFHQSPSFKQENLQKTQKTIQTLHRFYGTSTAIISRKSTNQQTRSQFQQLVQENSSTQVDPSINIKKKTSFQSIHNTSEVKQFIRLTQNQDLFQGIYQYTTGNYHSAIQLLLQQFNGLLINNLRDIDDIKDLKPLVISNLSIYQSRKLANLTFYIGNSYFRIQQYTKSILFYKIDDKLIIEEKQQKAQRYNNMGSCYVKIGKQHMSLQYYEKALKMYQQSPHIDKSNLMYNIANMYLNFGMYQQANEYFKMSIEERKIKSPYKNEMLCKTYFYLALSQRHQGKTQSSIRNFIFAKQVAQNQTISRNLHQKILYQMAASYEIMKNWRKALNFYQKIVEQILKKGQNRIQLGEIYEKVSIIFKRLNNQQKYLYFKKKSLQEYRNKFNDNNEGQVEGNESKSKQQKIAQLKQKKYKNRCQTQV